MPKAWLSHIPLPRFMTHVSLTLSLRLKRAKDAFIVLRSKTIPTGLGLWNGMRQPLLLVIVLGVIESLVRIYEHRAKCGLF